MGQSFTRKMKRGHLVPVFNILTAQFDFYRKAKNSGLYLLVGHNPYGNINSVGRGPGYTTHEINQMKKKENEAMKNRKFLKKNSGNVEATEPEKKGFIKRIFGS